MNADACAELQKAFPEANVLNATASIDNINTLVDRDSWFVSIDVDSHDWWLWANMTARPALVVVETNPVVGMFLATYGCKRKGADGYGMSVEAARALGELKGYDYIGRTAVNGFFVRKDLACTFRLPEQTEHRGRTCRPLNNVFA
jgi:hypothetical protein